MIQYHSASFVVFTEILGTIDSPAIRIYTEAQRLVLEKVRDWGLSAIGEVDPVGKAKRYLSPQDSKKLTINLVLSLRMLSC